MPPEVCNRLSDYRDLSDDVLVVAWAVETPAQPINVDIFPFLTHAKRDSFKTASTSKPIGIGMPIPSIHSLPTGAMGRHRTTKRKSRRIPIAMQWATTPEKDN